MPANERGAVRICFRQRHGYDHVTHYVTDDMVSLYNITLSAYADVCPTNQVHRSSSAFAITSVTLKSTHECIVLTPSAAMDVSTYISCYVLPFKRSVHGVAGLRSLTTLPQYPATIFKYLLSWTDALHEHGDFFNPKA